MERGTRFIWRAAGSPTPTETDGSPIKTAASAGHCASCGEPANYRMSSAISDNFTTVRNASRAWAFGGDSLCAACVWACKTPALRCGLFFARENGIWYVPTWALKGLPQTRPDPLAALLCPPDPPFVAGYPLFGVDHGGEDALERCMLAAPEITETIREIREAMDAAADVLLRAKPKYVDAAAAKKIVRRALVNLSAPWPSSVDVGGLAERFGRYRYEPWWRWAAWPMVKIQSKHVALYARVSTSRERYHLQVDDANDVMVDVALWTRMRSICEPLLVDMRAHGVGSREAVAALVSLRAPRGLPMRLLARWSARVTPLRECSSAAWWPIFTSLLPMPTITKGFS